MWAAFGLLGLAFGCRVARADQLDCLPPQTNTTWDSLNVAFHQDTLNHVCHRIPIDSARMVDYCKRFCAVDGQDSSVPLFLGSGSFGFDLGTMQDICFDIADANATLKYQCAETKHALTELEQTAAELVARVAIFKAEQTAFRAAADKKADDLQAELSSPEFVEQLDLANDKALLLREIFGDFAQQVAAFSAQDSDLWSALQALLAASRTLVESIDGSLGAFEWFVSNCNKFLVGVGSQDEFLLDTCPVTGSQCIEEAGATHVGCCCAINPLVSGMEIDGATSLSPHPIHGHVGGTPRRVQGSSETAMDVCAEANRRSASGVESANSRTRTYGKEQYLVDYDASLRAKYPEYFASCSARRLSEAHAQVPSNVSLKVRESRSPSRILTSNRLECTPPIHTNTSLKVAFSSTTLADICSLQTPVVTYDHMQEQCRTFCADSGVSMLMGSAQYGFGFDTANSICLPPEGVMTHDPDQLERCQSWSAAFLTVERAVSNFTAEINIFRAASDHYMATVRTTTDAIEAHVTSGEFAETMQRASNKEETLKRAFSDGLNEVESTDALIDAITSLKAAGRHMQAVLEENVELIEMFLLSCNDFHIGVGPQREYLLDICAQASAACGDDTSAPHMGHVTCCCAYHPFTTFGSPPTYPINGVSGLAGGEVANRRLSEGTAMDICPEAWTASSEPIAYIYDEIVELGQSEVFEYRQQTMKSIYDADYCAFHPSPAHDETVANSCFVPGMRFICVVWAFALQHW